MASRVGLAIVGALVAIAACNRDPAPRIGSAGRGPLTLRRLETRKHVGVAVVAFDT